MIDSKATLIKLHKKFPNLSLDDLFDILDCYVEEIKIYNSFKDCLPNDLELRYTGVDEQKFKINDGNTIISTISNPDKFKSTYSVC